MSPADSAGTLGFLRPLDAAQQIRNDSVNWLNNCPWLMDYPGTRRVASRTKLGLELGKVTEVFEERAY